MTTTTNENTTTETATEAEVQTPETNEAEATQTPETEAPEPEGKEGKPAREAAKYRRQLREAEAERDQLREAVTKYQRAAVEESVKSKLGAPKLLWVDGRTPAELMGDDGLPDPAKVQEAVAAVVSEYGPSVKPRGNYVPNEGLTSRNPRGDDGSFKSAFRPRPND